MHCLLSKFLVVESGKKVNYRKEAKGGHFFTPVTDEKLKKKDQLKNTQFACLWKHVIYTNFPPVHSLHLDTLVEHNFCSEF